MKNSKRERITLHLDMDSFYSSVEVRERPELEGLPVVVGSDPKGGSGEELLAHALMRQRVFGLHSGMPISKAYRLCPDATYLRVNMKLYKQASEEIVNTIRIFADKFQQVSVDEAYLDIGDSIDDYESATLLAKKIKSEVKRFTG
ncbi:MAG: hypothetical protein R2741_02380 [Methanolobus sp.]